MKHDTLRSIAHALADSLQSGCSLLTGVYELNMYTEIARVSGGRLTVDLLHGTVPDGAAPPLLEPALPGLREALEHLCAKAGVTMDGFQVAQVLYRADALGGSFTVIVEDRSGDRSETDYSGDTGARVRVRSGTGKSRRSPVRRTRAVSVT